MRDPMRSGKLNRERRDQAFQDGVKGAYVRRLCDLIGKDITFRAFDNNTYPARVTGASLGVATVKYTLVPGGPEYTAYVEAADIHRLTVGA